MNYSAIGQQSEAPRLRDNDNVLYSLLRNILLALHILLFMVNLKSVGYGLASVPSWSNLSGGACPMCYSAMLRQDLKYLQAEFGAEPSIELWDFVREQAQGEPRLYKLPTSDGRIFPNYFAPVVYAAPGCTKIIAPMRYSAFPPLYLAAEQTKGLTTYNARLESLGRRFWSESFMHCHGIVAIRGFYEWVMVSDLIKGGVVTLDQIHEELANQVANRRKRLAEQGKKYVLTKNDRVEATSRKVIIRFQPENHHDLIVPVIFSHHQESGMMGFAIITTEPSAEIMAAGHDRMPCTIDKTEVERWLHPQGQSPRTMLEMLSSAAPSRFLYELERTAV